MVKNYKVLKDCIVLILVNKKDIIKNTSHSQYIRAWRRKLKLLDIFGSHCEICGYNKNIAALEFHHKDSTQKEFKLDARKLANTKWENILIEAKKCQLLCSNCHRELHNPEMESNLIKDKLSRIKNFNMLLNYVQYVENKFQIIKLIVVKTVDCKG